jgi:UDP-N-acetylmuramoyl-tripeptide--D-alanyl-D-alanine ligase
MRVRPWHRFAVLEIGIGAFGQMERQARLVKPDVAIILGVQRTHTTSFESLDQHAEEKAVLLHHLNKNGVAVLNGDDIRVSRFTVPGKRVLFGTSGQFDIWATEISFRWPEGLSFTLRSHIHEIPIRTQLIGRHWLPPVLAALASGLTLGVAPSAISSAILDMPPFPARLSAFTIPGGAIILRDDYSASIESLNVDFEILRSIQLARRFLVLTDFSDSGQNRKKRLRYLAKEAAQCVDHIVIIGESADYGRRRAVEAGISGSSAHAFPTIEQASEFLRNELRNGDVALIKGRTTDHAGRIFFGLLGPIECRKNYCPKRLLCDFCWELGISEEDRKKARPLAVSGD